MAYCTTADLLVGDIRESGALNYAKYVSDAADEIDSKIGFVYETPIPISGAEAVPRPVALLLKRINAHLASGRLILAATVAAEDEKLNAYGESLVRDALAAVEAIASGQIVLDGATPSGLTPMPSNAPLILNGDPESSVDAFYERVINPSYRPTYQVVNPFW